MNNKDPRVKTMNPKIGGPLALVLVIGVGALFIYGWKKDKEELNNYLSNPKIHDIYYMQLSKYEFTVMELLDIKGDEIQVQKGDFTTRDKKDLSYKDWTYGPAEWIKMSELRRMYDDDIIYKVLRPAQQN